MVFFINAKNRVSLSPAYWINDSLQTVPGPDQLNGVAYANNRCHTHLRTGRRNRHCSQLEFDCQFLGDKLVVFIVLENPLSIFFEDNAIGYPALRYKKILHGSL